MKKKKTNIVHNTGLIICDKTPRFNNSSPSPKHPKRLLHVQCFSWVFILNFSLLKLLFVFYIGYILDNQKHFM
jgi:hypothetical protein